MEQQTDFSTKPKNMNNSYSGQELDNKPEDEINLSDLAVSVYNVLKRNIKLVTALSFLGLIAGLLYWHFAPTVYQASFTALSREIPVEQIDMITSQLETALTEKDIDVVAESLDMARDQANSITKISLQEEEKESETSLRFFSILVEGTDKNVLKEVDKKVIQYINENNYLLSKNKLERQKILDEVNDLKLEISKLESLQKELSALLNGGGTNGETSKTNLYFSELPSISRQILTMKSDVAELNYKLEKFDEVQLIQGVFGITESDDVKSVKTVMLFALLAFGLSIVLIFGKESYKYLESKSNSLEIE